MKRYALGEVAFSEAIAEKMESTNTIFVQTGFGLKHCEMQHINVIIHTYQEHNFGFDFYDQTKMVL